MFPSATVERATPPQGSSEAHARGSAAKKRIALAYTLLALLVSIPSLWQRHIQADDLSSHLYNAWLANQVSAGQLPGLYLAPQFTNVFFDHVLSLLLKTGSVILAEHAAVLVAVQIFFWSCFAFVSTVAGRRAWAVAPLLMMLSYGAVFRMGFSNFYIGVGLGLLAIALVWSNPPRVRWLVLPMLALTFIAHAIPFAWALGAIAYIIVARHLDPRRRVWLMAAGIFAIAAIALFLKIRVPSRWPPAVPLLSAFGVDQVLIFGMKYTLPAAALLSLSILLLLRGFDARQLKLDGIAFQLWVMSAAACLLLPDAVWSPFYSGILTWISIRMSLLAAILLCATVATVRWSLLERSAAWVLLALFLSFTYIDERAIGAVEQQMARAVATVPPGTRVVSTLADSHLFVIFMGVPRGVPALEHLMDRVCIGRCFSFGSYEAATTQFRLRAKPANPYMVSDPDDASALEHGEYVWQRRDIDLYKLYPCEMGGGVCALQVKPGETLVKHEFPSVPGWWGK
jgi:hypothetical protein